MRQRSLRSNVLIGLAAVVVAGALAASLLFLSRSSGAPGKAHVVGPFVLDSSLTLEVINAGPTINGASVEFAPVIAPDGNMLYFTSDRKDPLSIGAMDIWSCAMHLGDTDFARPRDLGGPIDTRMNEGVTSITADGRHLFYDACERPQGLGECDIFEATLDEHGKIIAQRPLTEINSRYWETDPDVTPDGTTLYFASNRPDGYTGAAGNEDIWVSTLSADGSWSSPRRLDVPINSKDRDGSPCIVGNHLYFSSNRPHGYGGFDLYVSTASENGSWGRPVNLGPLFNTKDDERYISTLPGGRVFFFSSDRRDLTHYGALDIYMARPYRGR
jgi:hypothetical protein